MRFGAAQQLAFDLPPVEVERPTIENPGPEPVCLAEMTERADGVFIVCNWRGKEPRQFESRGKAGFYLNNEQMRYSEYWNLWRVATLAPRLRPVIPLVHREDGYIAASLGRVEAAAMYAGGQELGDVCQFEDGRLVILLNGTPDSTYGYMWDDTLRWLVYDAIMADCTYGEDWPEKYPDLLACVTVEDLTTFGPSIFDDEDDEAGQ